MKTKLLFAILAVLLAAQAFSQQQYRQYFDGADTVFTNTSPRSIQILIDPDISNIWQVGAPHKAIFDSAATSPNVIVTDTMNFYPPNNSSSFQFTIVPWSTWGILAVRWKQKLDMDSAADGGKIEFSIDAGTTWQNAFDNPYVYNFYGFDPSNVDTLANNDAVFTGTDSLWKDIWLCYHMGWASVNDSIMLRFTFESDETDNSKEGWMIDNMVVHPTIIHTAVNEKMEEKYLSVFPNPASDRIHIETQKLNEYHIIEYMSLINSQGQIVDEWKNIPTKFFIDSRKYDNGTYHLRVKTNIREESVPIVISHY